MPSGLYCLCVICLSSRMPQSTIRLYFQKLCLRKLFYDSNINIGIYRYRSWEILELTAQYSQLVEPNICFALTVLNLVGCWKSYSFSFFFFYVKFRPLHDQPNPVPRRSYVSRLTNILVRYFKTCFFKLCDKATHLLRS